jgi:hypothetical protein
MKKKRKLIDMTNKSIASIDKTDKGSVFSSIQATSDKKSS